MVVIDHHLVGCANDGKLFGGATRLEMAHDLLVKDFFSLGFVAMIHLNRDRWHPFVELINPIRQCAKGRHYEMRPKILLLFS